MGTDRMGMATEMVWGGGGGGKKREFERCF